MNARIKKQAEHCIEQLKAGTLTEESLAHIVELAESGLKQQDLLYLQTNRTSPISPVVGMRIVEDGEISDGPADPEDWPYGTVLEAIRDGWRIIKFPEQALMLDETRTYGLGAEFVLER
jgi:hypothetical protein